MLKKRSADRNLAVERAVIAALNSIDLFIEGEKLDKLPTSRARQAADIQLSHRSNSVRLASLFFVFYALQDEQWDFNKLPKGLRGEFGDKRLATGLALRNITLHNAITAFGENLGWKGDVRNIRLQASADKFAPFMTALLAMSRRDIELTAAYMASRFADSRRVLAPLPSVSDEVLTYPRARQLFDELVRLPSEGNIPQFLVAALLSVHRARYGYEIRTHHVHASDTSDSTSGDIEEFFEGVLHRAYEVTVRPDWKNRLADFRAKMDKFSLKKYTIIASNVLTDDELSEPANMVSFLQPIGRDLAVVDLCEFLDVFAMELSAEELRQAVNRAHELLLVPKLCGRADIIDRYSRAVSHWLDEVPLI